MALDLLLDDEINLVSLLGPAGTGKTFLVLLAGLCKVAKENRYRKLLISRSIVALGADIGYLPGDVRDKLRNWMQPMYDNLEFIFSETPPLERRREEITKDRGRPRRRMEERHITQIERLEQRGVISMEAITYMRGRSIPNQYVFIDEVQNLTPHGVKTSVSRAGDGTKVILAGDPHQVDSPFLDFTSNGLTVTSEKLKSQPIFGTVYLETSERSGLAKLATELL
jgi:PhoH-like ATPase